MYSLTICTLADAKGWFLPVEHFSIVHNVESQGYATIDYRDWRTETHANHSAGWVKGRWATTLEAPAIQILALNDVASLEGK
jgi:hypothetical protein